VKVSIDDIRAHPCPTCKMPADSHCVQVDENGEGGTRVDGVHNTRIHRYQIVTAAMAENEEIEAMTDIEIRNQQQAIVPDRVAMPSTDLEVWARQATAAAIYAERVCSTLMVPAAYRGKPAEACAAILAGAELGFSPMRSLNAFDNIQGTPAPKAVTLRALVQAAGHEIVIEESSDERAVVAGRRRGAETWQRSVWDLPRAQKLAQFKSNPNYRTNLAQMLVARATAEVCRWVASDAIMGVPYAAEEIGDQPPVEARPIARKVTLADLDDEPPADVDTRGQADGMVNDHQRRTMFALWRDLGFDGDANRAQRLEITSKILGGLVVESSSDLTRMQAAEVIAKLQERKAELAAEQGGPQ
jgi:hypothetical protein